MQAKGREESKYIIQWKVANAPKIRRRRRTKRQIEEDKLRALNEKHAEKSASGGTADEAAPLCQKKEEQVPILEEQEQEDPRPTNLPAFYSPSCSLPLASSSSFDCSSSLYSSSESPPSSLEEIPTRDVMRTRAAVEDPLMDLLNDSLSFQKSLFTRSFFPDATTPEQHEAKQPQLTLSTTPMTPFSDDELAELKAFMSPSTRSSSPTSITTTPTITASFASKADDDVIIIDSTEAKATRRAVARWSRHEAPLGLLQNMRSFMLVFRRCYWTFTPIHRSSLCEKSLQRLLRTEGTWESAGDPLMLNLNIALAHGAHLLGATDVAEEYFARARRHLASLFDTNSYMVAQALFSMGYFLYAQGKFDQFSYYTSLALNACHQLRATGSMLHAKCLIAVNLDPTYSAEKKQKLVAEYNLAVAFPQQSGLVGGTSGSPQPAVQFQPGSCFFGQTWPGGFDRSSSSLSSSDDSHRYTADDDDDANSDDDDDNDFDEYDDDTEEEGRSDTDLLREVEHIDRYVLSLQTLSQLLLNPEDPGTDVTLLLVQFRQILARMNHELKRSRKLGRAYATSVTLAWYASAALYYLYANSPQEALVMATRYLGYAERDCHSAYCAASTLVVHNLIMDIFLRFGRYDFMQRLLRAVAPFTKLHPLARDTSKNYWDALHQHEAQRAQRRHAYAAAGREQRIGTQFD